MTNHSLKKITVIKDTLNWEEGGSYPIIVIQIIDNK